MVYDTNGQNVSAQLANITSKLDTVVYLESFPRLPGETDDTGPLQRAIDSFSGNTAGTILISKTIRISDKVTCNKTGLRLIGISNKKSKIISTYGGVALEIKPLYNGNPYALAGYCKFFMENIALQAEGDAVATGTGLWLQWIYASSFINLYTSGFARHIVLKGAHLNTFFNLYQENADTSEKGVEIFNRGVGLSAEGTLDEAGQTTSNNNHIIGGWLNNTSWDLTNLSGTVTEKIDIEPASNSIITGDGSTFKECRFERLDYYVVNGAKYPAFPWFIVGSNCRFYDNQIHQAGNSQTDTNPMFLIKGDLNKIEIPDHIPYNAGLISFNSTAKGNIIEYNGLYEDYQNSVNNPNYKAELTSILYNSQQNRFIYKDNLQGTITDVIGSHTRAQGEFICRSSKNTQIVNSVYYSYQGCTSESADIALPVGRTPGSPSFTKIILNTSEGNRRILLAPLNGQAVPTTGVYTLTAAVYIPSATSTDLYVGATQAANTKVSARNKWLTVRSRVWLNEGEKIIPTFELAGVTGDIFYVGEISVCDGNTAVYIANNTFCSVSDSF
jgi:hypothetical protein